MSRVITLYGRIFIQMDVRLLTGLHIGGSASGLEIGGVDAPVIRDLLTNQPYLPGSSMRGKMRSLTAGVKGRVQNFSIGQGVYIHMLTLKDVKEQNETEYHKAFRTNETCSIFGVTGDAPAPHPTALIVRDAYLSKESSTALQRAHTDLPFTEVKWEATIDRVTSAATPRQIERVPAGAIFTGLELVYNIYGQSNLTHLPTLLNAITLVEEDYLGGLGARGSGKVAFEMQKVYARKGTDYTYHDFSLQDKSIGVNHQPLLAWAQQLFADVPAEKSDDKP